MNKSTAKQRETYTSVEDYENNCYLFSPSISKRKTIGGKSYYVHRYFKGGNDFEIAMRKIAVKQANNKNAG